MQLKLPYFDIILSRLACGDPEFEETFGRHIHFGAWEDPDEATLDRSDCVQAMERLCQHLLGLAEVAPGQDILDVGCGFGGTLASLDEQFSPVNLTGLNIDPRQLEVARKRVTASPGNTIDFVQGDACAMTFPQASFDRVLAVECIFHFPSREAFFEHVSRILRPGGNLTLCDLLQPDSAPAGLWDSQDDALWGAHTAIDIEEYRALGARFGLELTHAEDISSNVRPTYKWFGRIFGQYSPGAEVSTAYSQMVMDLGGASYCNLRFDAKRS